MGKINWSRVFLGGLLAGVVLIVLGAVADAMYLGKLWDPTLEAMGHPLQRSVGIIIFFIVSSFVLGIMAVWLYSAIRPRYGAGAKTAVCAGLAFWALVSLIPNATFGFMGLFPANVLMTDSLTYLVVFIAATLLGAWIYKEQSR